MGITHVIRGRNLTNAACEASTQSWGWDVPVFAHGDDGTKLSKRHGALGVEAPDGGATCRPVRNYLVRLGRSHGDDEFFSTEQMVAWFDVDDIAPRASPRFRQVDDVNGHYVQGADAELLECIRAFLRDTHGGPAARIDEVGRLAAALPSLKGRAGRP